MPTYVATTDAPRPFSNYSQAVEVEARARFLYVSGQVGADLDASYPTRVSARASLAQRPCHPKVPRMSPAPSSTAMSTSPPSTSALPAVARPQLEGAKPRYPSVVASLPSTLVVELRSLRRVRLSLKSKLLPAAPVSTEKPYREPAAGVRFTFIFCTAHAYSSWRAWSFNAPILRKTILDSPLVLVSI